MMSRHKDIEKLTEFLRENGIPHLFIAAHGKNLSFSGLCDEIQAYEFLQSMIEINHDILRIMQMVVRDRQRRRIPSNDNTYLS